MSDPVTGGLDLVRKLNLKAVVSVLKAEGSISRTRIAKLTGLAKPTVSSLVGELLETGVVQQVGQKTGGRGRPSTLIGFNARSSHVAAVDYGIEQIVVAIADALGEPIATSTIAAPEDTESSIEAISASVGDLASESSVDPATLEAVVLSVASVDRWLPADGATLAEQLRRRIGSPVRVVTRAQARVVGETVRGHAVGAKNAVVLEARGHLATGLVLNGRLFRGADGIAGRIDACQLPGFSGHSTIGEMVAEQGLSALAYPSAWLINMVDPEVFVLAGSFEAASFGEIEGIRRSILEMCSPGAADRTKIAVTTGQDDTALRGAIAARYAALGLVASGSLVGVTAAMCICVMHLRVV